MTQQAVSLDISSPAPYVSVVIPVYNEEENLRELGERLMSTLSAMGRPFEIILVDDGSTDRSWEILTELNQLYPQNLRALRFHRNFGQHPAIFAGFQASRGQVIITLDADLQIPPRRSPAWWPSWRRAMTPWGAGGSPAATPCSGGCPPT